MFSYHSGGTFSEYLEELELSGFIRRDYAWSIKTGATSQLSRYRLRDNYLRFYLKYIEPRLDQIDKQQYLDVSLANLKGFETVIGLQIENLILNNRRLLHRAMEIDPNTIVNDNPYFQNATTKQQGCQIDYLIQTKYKTLYVFEIKFSRQAVTKQVIKQVQEKIKRLQLPKGFACLPVLIVAGDADPAVIEEDFFVKIIDMKDLLAARC